MKKIILNNENWDIKTLQALHRAMKQTKVDAWGICGLFYRPFFNNKFGAPQYSQDADIVTSSKHDSVLLSKWLKENEAWRRWSVEPRVENYPLGYRSINIRNGAVRLAENGIDVEVLLKDDSVLLQLDRGVLCVDYDAVDYYGGKESLMENAVQRAKKVMSEYPALTLSDELKEFFNEINQIEKPVIRTEYNSEFHKKVLEDEANESPRKDVYWIKFNNESKIIAKHIVDFYHNVDKKAKALEPIAPAKLPVELEKQRHLKEYAEVRGEKEPEITKVNPPAGFASWLHFMTREADDEMFKEWVLNQTRARMPYGGKDSYLASVLDFSIYQSLKNIRYDGEQKITHNGMRLDRHLANATMFLSTKSITSLGLDDDAVKNLRQALRLSCIHHDIGKLININEPGRHTIESANMWDKTSPDWVSDKVKILTRFLIIGHDSFGRMARGISEKLVPLGSKDFDVDLKPTYSGAIHPKKIVEAIKKFWPMDINSAILSLKELWLADTKSVHTLSWASGLADDLEKIIRLNI